MNGDDDESGALVPRSGGDLAKRSDALAKRGFELIDRINETVRSGKQAEAKRYLEEAWIEFGIGVENATNNRVLGYLIDAFDDGVKAAAAWLTIELAGEHSSTNVARRLFEESPLTPGTRSKQLIARMEIQESRGVLFLAQELNKVEGDLRTFIGDLEEFSDQVAALIDSSMATTSYKTALQQWNEVTAEQYRCAAFEIEARARAHLTLHQGSPRLSCRH